MKPKHEILGEVIERMARDQNNLHVKAATARLRGLNDALREFERIVTTRDPHETDASHVRRIAKAGERLNARRKDVAQRIDNDLTSEMQRYHAEAVQKSRLVPTERAREIREVLRNTEPKQRQTLLAKALESGDAETLAALDGPEYLTGIGKEQRDAMFHNFMQTKAAEEMAEIERIDNFASSLSTVYNEINSTIMGAVQPHVVMRNESAASKAKDADDRFARALDQVG